MTTAPGLDAGDFRTPVPLRRNRVHWFAGRTHEVLDEIGQPVDVGDDPPRARRDDRRTAGAAVPGRRAPVRSVADADRADVAARPAPPTPQPGCGPRPGSPAPRPPGWCGRPEPWSPPADPHGLGPGRIHTEQATVIVAAVDALPDEVADQRARRRSPPARLRPSSTTPARCAALGGHLLEVVAPDQADALIARQLEREEAQARKTCYLKTWSDGHGSTYGRFKIPDLTGTILTTVLEAYREPEPARPDPAGRRDAAPGLRAGVLRAARAATRSTGSPDRRHQRHRGGHDGPGHPARRAYRPRASWAPTPCSPPARPAGWPPQPGSSPPSWTASPSSSTWADDAPSPNPNASRWPSAKAACATSPAVNAPPPGATPTTDNPGAKAASPPSTTAS